MKKIDLGQTISILANIGVIAGIVFLGVELQQNNQLLRNQARFVLTDNIHAGNRNRAQDAELMDVRVKAINGETLSQAEILRLSADSSAVLANWVWEYEQYQLGLIDALPAYHRYIEEYPFFIEHYERVKEGLDPGFVQYMDENVVNER